MFPLFQARSLKGGEDETSTQLAELREMVAEIMQHFRREVHITSFNIEYQYWFVQQQKNTAIHRKREEHAQLEREQRKDI